MTINQTLTPEQRATIRREICTMMEDLGGVCLRIRDDEEGILPDHDDTVDWLTEVALRSKRLAQFVTNIQENGTEPLPLDLS